MILPRKTEWTSRLGPALEALRASESVWVDRTALEQLLGVSPRQAVRILRSLSPHLAGKSLVIGRQTLIGRLEAIRQGEAVQSEHLRLSRVAAELDTVRRSLAARMVTVPVAVPSASGLAGLSEGICLEPGRLQITFSDSQELLGKLLELARAVADDPEQFRAATAPGPR